MTSDKPAIAASYSSPEPSLARTFQHNLATPLSREQHSVADKKAYLAELRGLVTLVQAEVNVFLTERMEEDKKAAGTKDAELDAKEEQNYGEENVEDDDA